MPYKKNNNKTSRKGKAVYRTKKRMPNIERQVNRILNKKVETKMLPIETDDTTWDGNTAGYVYSVSSLATQGVDNEQRIGDVVNSIGLQYKFLLTSNNISRDYWMRVIVYSSERSEFDDNADNFLIDTANTPKALTANDLSDILSSLNRKQMGKIYMDKTFSIVAKPQTGSGGTPNNAVAIKFAKYFKCYGTKRIFSTDASGESEKGNLRILYVLRAKEGTGAVDDFIFTQYTRYYYKDY